jgi:integrase
VQWSGLCVVFFRFLFESDTTQVDLSLAIPQLVAPSRTVREGFSIEEVRKLLDVPDRKTSTGCRDYAMMILAAKTGLRGVDVIQLKRENIDWRRNEIRIMQEKTDKRLCLPLDPDVGNAIADYLLHHRPISSLPYVFLCANRPVRAFGAGIPSARG